MPDHRQFSLPLRSRGPRWVWVAALLLHIPVAIILLLVIARQHEQPAVVSQVPEIVMHDSSRAIPMPFSSADIVPVTIHPPRVAAAIASPVTPAVTPPTTVAAIAPAIVDTPPTGAAPGLRPRYGDGRLWVTPMTSSPRDIARTLTGKTDKELTDSAVSSMIQTYLDAMAKEQAENPTALPSWTTKIGGKTVGVDSRWIYLGPIKIPTMLLALLPIHMTGNMSDYQRNQQLQLMRADLFEAARHAATYDDFKQAVKDLHDETERKRQFKKNQSTPPDTSHHG